MKQAYFNEITIDLNIGNLVEKFEFVNIEITKTNNFANKLNEISKKVGTGFVKSSNSYIIVLEKDDNRLDVLKSIDGIIVNIYTKRMLARENPEIIVRALMRIMPDMKVGFFADRSMALEQGLFYFIKSEMNKSAVKTLLLDVIKKYDHTYIDIKQQVFVRGDRISQKDKSNIPCFKLQGKHLIFSSSPCDDSNYYKGAFRKKWGNDIDFYDWNNLEDCKVGILHKFISEFNKIFHRYCKISFVHSKSNYRVKSRKKKIKEDTARLAKISLQKDLNIISLEDCDIANLISSIKSISGHTPKITNTIQHNAYNILIHYDKDSYKNSEDPYKVYRKKYPNEIISSITVDTLEKNLTNAVQVIMKEFVIKDDLKNGKITVDKWIGKNIVFGLKYVIDKSVLIHLLSVDKEGIIDYYYSYPNNQQYRNFLESNPTFAYKIDDLNSSMIFCFDLDENIFLKIEKLPKFPLPDLDELKSFRESFEVGQSIRNDREKIETYINEFCELEKFETGEKEIFLEKINAWINTNKLKHNNHTDKFSKFLFDKYGIRLFTHGLKSEDGIMGYLKGIFVNEKELEYYIGKIDSLKDKIDKTPRVRKVTGNIDSIPSWYFELLEVGYVKNKDLTVLPYPFKYLRESINSWYFLNEENLNFEKTNILSSIISLFYD